MNIFQSLRDGETLSQVSEVDVLGDGMGAGGNVLTNAVNTAGLEG